MTSDPFEVLLGHNHWATKKILDLCRPLSHEQFHRPFPIGPGQYGGLHITITHMLSAQRRWEDWLTGSELRKLLERPPIAPEDQNDGRDRTPEELLEILNASTANLRTIIQQSIGRHHEPVIIRFGTTSYTFTRGAGIAHALTHGHYHRAQCMNMLRQLNVPVISDKLPELDVVDWQYEEEAGGKTAN